MRQLDIYIFGKGEDKMPEWVIKVVEALKEEWQIGNTSVFCDVFDWDSATEKEIAELIWKVYQENLPHES